ncbi:hypothetical protein BH10ACT7_BH10ACT7_04380 [soil metagenome]
MRLWLKDSERRPDPAPVKTDDRKAYLVGLMLWAIGLALVIVFLPTLTADGHGWWLWTCVAGLGLGLIGLLYTHWRHTR